EGERTANESQKSPGIVRHRCQHLAQDSFNFYHAGGTEVVEQGGIAFEVVQGDHRRLRQAVVGKGPGRGMVNLWCAVEMGPTQQKKPLTIRHPSPGEIRPKLPPTRRYG